MSKQLLLRLNRVSDLDLIYIYKSKDINYQKLVKKILDMYLENEYAQIKLPVLDVDSNKIKNEYQVKLYFSDEEYDKYSEIFTDIKNTYINAFLKNLIRSYLFFGYNTIYYTKEAQEKYDNKIKNATPTILEYDMVKEEIKIASNDKKSKRKTKNTIVSKEEPVKEDNKIETVETTKNNRIIPQKHNDNTGEEMGSETKNLTIDIDIEELDGFNIMPSPVIEDNTENESSEEDALSMLLSL